MGCTTTPTYQFHRHFDYGLLREPPGSLNYDAWCPSDEHGEGLWHTVRFNPFTASMSPITEELAHELIAGGDLYGPGEDAEYERQTAANLARHGIH